MQTEIFSRTKYKQNDRLGDDTFIHIPNVVAGVFDGASDPLGTMIVGEPAGLFAARNLAEICAIYFSEMSNRQANAKKIIEDLSHLLAMRIAKVDFKVRPSTTMALVIDLKDHIRLMTLGDSKIRINQDKIYTFDKRIDDVSTHARCMIFQHLARYESNMDQVEMLSRNIIFTGLDQAIENGILDQDFANKLVDETAKETGFDEHKSDIDHFIRGGIKVQQGYANDQNHSLGFASLNGELPYMSEVVDVTLSKSEIKSIEIYTDGYFAEPDEASINAWERKYDEVEQQDFHKIGDYRTVKGSTTKEYSDDRTIMIMKRS